MLNVGLEVMIVTHSVQSTRHVHLFLQSRNQKFIEDEILKLISILIQQIVINGTVSFIFNQYV